MSWFELHRGGRSPREWSAEQGRYLRAAGVDRALSELSGPYGLRRYLVTFASRGDSVGVTGIVAGPLAWGGGPPARQADTEAVQHLERALTSLWRNMSTGPVWHHGAIGVVRDRDNRTALYPLFDEDCEGASLDGLPAPDGPGHPLEDPAYLAVRAQHEAQFEAVYATTQRTGADWTAWRIHDGRLVLTYADGGTESHRCQVLGSYEPAQLLFAWQVEDPLFDGPPFDVPSFLAEWGDAFELGLLATARLQGQWLFAGRIGEADAMLLAAVLD